MRSRKRPAGPGKSTTLEVGSSNDPGGATVVVPPGDEELPAAKDAKRPSVPAMLAHDSGRRAVIVTDPAMLRLHSLLSLVAPTMLSVLVLGETGVGKEVIAQEVHERSKRASGPFLKLNCAALHESLLESELFGHEKGAFTGADKSRSGLLEAADAGTLFLDEVGELPIGVQAKFLRFLESGEVLRLGSLRPKRVDVRIISATNRDLSVAMAMARFRQDLYFRLNGITVSIPPLRERTGDIPDLAKLFLHQVATKLSRPVPRLSDDAFAKLTHYSWPGNVRELRSTIERSFVLATGEDELRAEHFDIQSAVVAPMAPPKTRPVERSQPPSEAPPEARQRAQAKGPKTIAPTEGEDPERERILRALKLTGWNQSKAARKLGVSRAVIIHRIKRFGLKSPDESEEDD